jgi:hypothetical protein
MFLYLYLYLYLKSDDSQMWSVVFKKVLKIPELLLPPFVSKVFLY